MTIPAFWQEPWTAALVNHLWQSTMVLGIVWLLSRALSKNSAQVRYCIWMAASLKFLLPFSLFVDAGAWMRSLIMAPAGSTPAAAAVMRQIAQPFPDLEFVDTLSPMPARRADLIPALLVAVWLCGMAIVVARWAREWLRVRAVVRTAVPLELAATEVPAFSCVAQMEPGIFGIFRPVLLLPEGIWNRLAPAQLKAVVAHEMCHVRRRDNLMYALHMIVEATFWFYPLVWWIGARLIDERERACDEEVVQAGNGAEDYAEGILIVCKHCLESPLACVSGITGSDLKKRIGRIVGTRMAYELGVGRKLLLGFAGAFALGAPLVLGLVQSAQSDAQAGKPGLPSVAGDVYPSFEVATIKPDDASAPNMPVYKLRGRNFVALRASLEDLIAFAYGLQRKQIVHAPGWIRSERYDVNAVPDSPGMPNMEQLRMMVRKLLANRFKLTVHDETRVLPAYVMTADKDGEKLTPDQGKRQLLRLSFRAGKGGITMRVENASMPVVTSFLQEMVLDRPVVDRTGLGGRYDFECTFAPDDSEFSGHPPRILASSDPGPTGGDTPTETLSAPGLFEAMRQQLGLKLSAEKRAVNVIAVDHVDHPSPN